jgi:hypothetical protein
MRRRSLIAALLLSTLIAAALAAPTGISTIYTAVRPPSFGPYTIGIVTLSDITITGSQGGYDECSALATVNYTDASQNPLVFNVTGLLSQSDHSVFSFTGIQYGTWTFPGGSPTLDFLAINYTSANKEGHVSGGSKYVTRLPHCVFVTVWSGTASGRLKSTSISSSQHRRLSALL